MALAERPSGKPEETKYSYLKDMKAVREALGKQVKEAYGTFDLDRLEHARLEHAPLEEKVLLVEIVEKAFEAARVEYENPLNPNHGKSVQLKEVKEAFNKGGLTLVELLEGLRLKAQQVESGRGRSLIERIRESLRRA